MPSPDPAFNDAPVPLVSSFLVCAKKGKEVRIEPIVDKHARSIRYIIHKGGTDEEIKRAREGTKSGRAIFRCLLSDAVIPAQYIRDRAKAGEMGATLIAIVADGNPGRIYIAPTAEHEKIALSAQPGHIPSERLVGKTRVSIPLYGMETFGDLFTNRQLVSMNTLSDLVHEVQGKIMQDALAAGFPDDATPLRAGGNGAKAYSEAIGLYLALCIGRMANRASSLNFWGPDRENVVQAFGRQALAMTWDFAEGNIFSTSTGNFLGQVEYLARAVENLPASSTSFETQQDARHVHYSPQAVLNTDPPYYDNICYADISDFFYAWLRPLVKDIYPEETTSLATPKEDEIVASAYRRGGKPQAETYFLDGMKEVMHNAAAQTSPDFPAIIYYAFKQSEIAEEGIISTGWVTFLQAVIDSGFSVTGTWPVRTEMSSRTRAINANALASSIVLVCRKREATAETITRPEFLAKLKEELPAALKQLQEANIAPADMPQSAIGPGIAIFSRYKMVLEANDNPMSVKDALQRINHEIDAHLADLEGDFDPQTRFAITWFAQHGMEEGDYGSAETLATARGISVAGVQQAGIIVSRAGKVRILKPEDLHDDWTPPSPNFSVWQGLHQLIRAHQRYSVTDLSIPMFLKVQPKQGQIRDLAYRLYDICTNTRKKTAEAFPYNSLIADWNEFVNEAAGYTPPDTRQTPLLPSSPQ